jgi:hypothetical protein
VDPTLLFIMGTGRSGTTVLEILLGAAPGVAGLGELKHIFQDGWVANQLCACGRPARECQFWSAVLRDAGWSEAEAVSTSRFLRRIEAHGRFPAVALGLVAAGDRERYRAVHHRLLLAAASVAHAGTLVESSMYPARAILLARSLPGRVKVVMMSRDPAGLMTAFAKPNEGEQLPKSVVGTMLYYGWVMACARVAAWLIPGGVCHVRFEDLKRDPEGTLARVGAWAGIDTSAVRRRLEANGSFGVGHIVTGNRLRKAGEIRFSRGPEPPVSRGVPGRVAVAVMRAWRRLLRW